jgi:hypothetical protein
MFSDPRGPYLGEAEVMRTAGRFPFYWTRAIYSGGGFRGGRNGSWAVDFPKSDQQFLIVIKRLVRLNAYDWENPVPLWAPELRKFPLIYMLEVGGMYLTDVEVEGLRGYMDAGGFVIVDDFPHTPTHTPHTHPHTHSTHTHTRTRLEPVGDLSPFITIQYFHQSFYL